MSGSVGAVLDLQLPVRQLPVGDQRLVRVQPHRQAEELRQGQEDQRHQVGEVVNLFVQKPAELFGDGAPSGEDGVICQGY